MRSGFDHTYQYSGNICLALVFIATVAIATVAIATVAIATVAIATAFLLQRHGNESLSFGLETGWHCDSYQKALCFIISAD